MKEYTLTAISLIIGAILAVSNINHQEAYATDIDELMMKMVEVDSKISNLKNLDNDFNERTIGSVSFEMKQIGESLLEINELNDRNNDKANKIYEYLKNNYSIVFEKYQKEAKEYQKENGLTMQENKLVTDLRRDKVTFESNESQQNFEKTQEELINISIKETISEENYQKLINTIGIKLADEANGNKVENIHHKIAIKEIINSKSLELAIPAIDRIITQTNNDEMKNRLVEIKKDVKEALDKKEKHDKQNQVYELKNGDKIKDIISVDFNQIGIENSFVLDQILEDGIIKLLADSEEIVSEFEESVKQNQVSKIEHDAPVVSAPIILSEPTQSPVDVISDEHDDLEEEKEDKEEKEDNDGSAP